MSGSSSTCRRTSLAAGRARWGLLLLSLAAGLWLVAAGVGAAAPAPARRVPREEARSKIQHVVIIMQENRSFDHYFGTYPGANGIPMDANGVPTVCNPNPLTGTCDKPFLDTGDVNYGGPHFMRDAITAIDGGKMDGFIIAAANKGQPTQDVMSYHDRGQIPNYWAYADTYLLQDNLFEPVESWTLPSHLFLVSAWSARCPNPADPMSCINDPANPRVAQNTSPLYAWTDITYLLHKNKVSWKYYVNQGIEPECPGEQLTCAPRMQLVNQESLVNPLPAFTTVHDDHELSNIVDEATFATDAVTGNLPSVAWVVPSHVVSEHPTAHISAGQAYVTGLINAVMQRPDWNSTAIFLAWDDWGGFYDHVPPPTIDQNGYGIRVPGLLISPYAKHTIDHQTLSFDAYLKFIEDLFLGGQRLDPATDGRPDPRPTVRENVAQLGDLLDEFDFSQTPRPILILPPYPSYTRVEDTAPAISYVGSWRLRADRRASGGTEHVASDPGATATLTFTGTDLAVTLTKGPQLGIANVTLDGTVTPVDLYSPAPLFQQIVFEAHKLRPVSHVLQIAPSGTKNSLSSGLSVPLDAIDYQLATSTR